MGVDLNVWKYWHRNLKKKEKERAENAINRITEPKTKLMMNKSYEIHEAFGVFY